MPAALPLGRSCSRIPSLADDDKVSSWKDAETSAVRTRCAARKSQNDCSWRIPPVAPTAAFTRAPSQTSAVLTQLGGGLTVNSAAGVINGGNSVGDEVDNQATINVTGTLNVYSYVLSNEGSISGGAIGVAFASS